MKPKIIKIITLLLVISAASYVKIALQKATEKAHLRNLELQQSHRLVVQDAVEGSGRELFEGNTAKIHYSIRLPNGTEVENNFDKPPIELTIGQHQATAGLEYGILGMKPKGRRFIRVPSSQGFGDQGAGSGLIPPNSEVIYEVELISIKCPSRS